LRSHRDLACLISALALELGLAVRPAHPLNLERPVLICHNRDDIAGSTKPAPISRDLPSTYRHSELSPCRVPCPAVSIAQRRCVAAADGELAVVRLAPAPDGGGMADGAVPAARAGSSPAALRPAKADER
jgi:hypothetical protein